MEVYMRFAYIFRFLQEVHTKQAFRTEEVCDERSLFNA